jgi:hypothetical protein
MITSTSYGVECQYHGSQSDLSLFNFRGPPDRSAEAVLQQVAPLLLISSLRTGEAGIYPGVRCVPYRVRESGALG